MSSAGSFIPGLGSMLARSSRWGRSLLRLAGSPVLCSAMVSSWTLWAKDAGVCSYVGNTKKNVQVSYGYLIWDCVLCKELRKKTKSMQCLTHQIYQDIPVKTYMHKTKTMHTLSIIDCICDLWDWSPYNREDHWSGAMRSPPSIAIWTIWESCSRRRAS